MVLNDIRFKSSLGDDLLIMKSFLSPFIKWLWPVIVHIIFAFSIGMTWFKCKNRRKISVFTDKLWKNIFFYKHSLPNGQCIIWFKATMLHLHQEISDSFDFSCDLIYICESIWTVWFQITPCQIFLYIHNRIDPKA